MNFLLVFGVGTVLLGLVFIVATLRERRQHETVGDWPTTSGTVIASVVQSHKPRPEQKTAATYTPLVTYTYRMGEQDYTSHNLDFLPLRSHVTAASAEAIVARYPVGSEVKVYYNPLGPQQAALDRGKPIGYHTELASGLVNVLVGILLIVVAVLFR